MPNILKNADLCPYPTISRHGLKLMCLTDFSRVASFAKVAVVEGPVERVEGSGS